MLTTLDHVIVAVRDLEASGRDYAALLGLSPSWQGSHPGAGTADILFRLENTCLELLSPAGVGEVGDRLRGFLDHGGDRLIGLAFGTEDLASCRATLLERGLAPGPIEAGIGRDRSSGAEHRWRSAMLPLDRTHGIVVFPIRHEPSSAALPMACPVGDAQGSVYALDHAVVQTLDCDRARSLFGDGLGLRLALDREFKDWGVRLMFFRVGGVTVEVAGVLPGADAHLAMPGGHGNAVEATAHDRLYGMSYRVRSVDAARARLAAAGFDVSEVRTGRRPRTRVFTVRSRTCGVPTLMLETDVDSGGSQP